MANVSPSGRRGRAHGRVRADSPLREKTLKRSLVVQGIIHRTLAVAYSHLSRLNGRTLAEYCNDERIPRYIAKYLTDEENKLIASDTPVDKYEVKLLYKLFKTCCGLSSPKDKRWNSEDDRETFEFLITFCYTAHIDLQEASTADVHKLKLEMDKVLDALLLLIGKVEKEKKVDETSLKSELMKHIRGDVDYDAVEVSLMQNTYNALTEHTIHQMLVMVYTHLNNLNGRSLSNYLKKRRINLISRTRFSNEGKYLEGNPSPHKMPVSILYPVVKRVCFNFDKLELRKKDAEEELEIILSDLKKEFNTPPKELTKEQMQSGPGKSDESMRYIEKCCTIYTLLDRALEELCNKKGKDRRSIIGDLAQERLDAESVQALPELPVSSSQDASSSLQDSTPPDSPTAPDISTGLSQLVIRSSPGQSNLKAEEVNVSVLFRIMCPGGLVAQTLALVYYALRGRLQDVMDDKKNWKNAFTRAEKELIRQYDSNTGKIKDMADKDLTFLCKMLRYGCPRLSKQDDVWQTIADTVEYNITVVKRERNRLAHEVSTIKSEDLKQTLEIIENSLDIILEKTVDMLQPSENDMKTKLQKQKTEVQQGILESSKLSQAIQTKNYWTKMEEIINNVKTIGQQELLTPYLQSEILQCLSPISGSSDPRHKFLTIKEVFMERMLEDKGGIKAEGTYRVEDMLFCQNNALSAFKVFIVHGRPGDGKTSICKYAYHLWSRDVQESSQKGVDLLFYISCRNVTTKSLPTYMKKKLPQAFAGTNTDDIIPLLQEPQILFVIDGYDEAGKEAKGLIDDILTSLPDSKMIITTKTQWTPKLIEKVKNVTSRYQVLSLVEMTEEERQQYVKKIFKVMRQKDADCFRFLQYLDEMKENLNSLIQLPLTFSLLALLWIEEPGKAKKIRTLAQLYHKLIGLTLERVTKQLDKDDTYYCHEWMIALGELAWENLKKNKHHLSEEDQTPLKRRAEDLKLGVEGNNQLISSLMNCEIRDTLVGSETIWTFMLTSQQEYFAAEYIVDTIKKDKTASISKMLELSPSSREEDKNYNKKLQRLLPVLEFICGLLVIHDHVTEARLKDLTQIMAVKEPWCFIATEKMFKLLEDNSQLKSVLKEMFAGQKMETFEGHDIQNALWVLRNTSLHVPSDVTLTYNASDVPQMQPLLTYLVMQNRKIKVIVDVDKTTNISVLARFASQDGYKDIKFFFRPWKPLCFPEVIMKWPYSRPLHLKFEPALFPLMWWEALMCLLTMEKQVRKVVLTEVEAPKLYKECDKEKQKYLKMVTKAAENLLKAETVIDDDLEEGEVIIHC